MAAFDIKIDKPFDYDTGDFEINDTDYQNVQACILAEKGHFYQFPTFGVGIQSRINSPYTLYVIRQEIVDELSKDSYHVNEYEAVLADGKTVEIHLDAQLIET